MRRYRFVAVLLLASCKSAVVLEQGRWVDLSYPFDSTTIYWPTAKPFRLDVVSAQRTPAGYYYAANNFAAAEHGGTHLDAPVHFAEGKHTTDEIPLNQLIGPVSVIDVAHEADSSADYRITTDDITKWEATHGKIGAGMIVLFHTGWG